jgi:HSP20 family protein
MDIVRWDPFGQALSLRQAVDRLFEDSFVRPTRLLSVLGDAALIHMDVYQTKDELVVKAAVPGVEPKDLDISITGDTLTIRGESKADQMEGAEYLLQERHYGSFSRTLTLPVALDSKKADASFENGVVTIRIPKAEEARPKAIKVKVQRTVEDK